MPRSKISGLVPALLAASALHGVALASPAWAASPLTVLGDSHSIPVHDGTRDWPAQLRDRGADSRVKRNGSSEADLHVLAKLGEQGLERGEEAEALPRRQVVAEDDLLQLGVAHGVEVPRQVAA